MLRMISIGNSSATGRRIATTCAHALTASLACPEHLATLDIESRTLVAVECDCRSTVIGKRWRSFWYHVRLLVLPTMHLMLKFAWRVSTEAGAGSTCSTRGADASDRAGSALMYSTRSYGTPGEAGAGSMYWIIGAASIDTSGMFDTITCGCKGALRCWQTLYLLSQTATGRNCSACVIFTPSGGVVPSPDTETAATPQKYSS